MSEKRFLNFVFTEGLLLTILGACILILPKLTSMSFGVMLSVAFITYGVYKIATTIINRNYSTHFLWSLILGLYILTIGILLLLVPKISLLWLVALTGVFFLLESISSVAFFAQIHTIFNYHGYKNLTAFVLFLIGLSILLGIPVISFWIISILCGVAFVVKGMGKITLSLANRNNYNN